MRFLLFVVCFNCDQKDIFHPNYWSFSYFFTKFHLFLSFCLHFLWEKLILPSIKEIRAFTILLRWVNQRGGLETPIPFLKISQDFFLRQSHFSGHETKYSSHVLRYENSFAAGWWFTLWSFPVLVENRLSFIWSVLLWTISCNFLHFSWFLWTAL